VTRTTLGWRVEQVSGAPFFARPPLRFLSALYNWGRKQQDLVAARRNLIVTFQEAAEAYLPLKESLAECRRTAGTLSPNSVDFVARQFEHCQIQIENFRQDSEKQPEAEAVFYARRQATKLYEAAGRMKTAALLDMHAHGIQDDEKTLDSTHFASDSERVRTVIEHRYEKLQRFATAHLNEEERGRLEELLRKTRCHQALCFCRATALRICEFDVQLRAWAGQEKAAELAAQVEPIDRWLRDLASLEAQAKKAAEPLSEVVPEWESVARDTESIRSQAAMVQGLAKVNGQLAGIASEIDTRAKLVEGRRLLEEAGRTMAILPKLVPPSIVSLHDRTAAALEIARKQTIRAEAVVQGLEFRASLDAQLDDGEKALANGLHRHAFLACHGFARLLGELRHLLLASPELRKDVRFATVCDRYSSRLAEFRKEVGVSLRKARAAANWIRLPIDGSPLVPGTLDHHRVGIEWLIAKRRLDEANHSLARLVAAYPDAAQGPIAVDLDVRIHFARAASEEAADDLASALQGYWQVADEHPDHPFGAAAKSAVARIQTEISRRNAPQRDFWRLFVVGGFVLGGIVFAGWFASRDSRHGRLRRVRRHLDAAQACKRRGQSGKQDRHLQYADSLLSGFPEDHSQRRRSATA